MDAALDRGQRVAKPPCAGPRTIEEKENACEKHCGTGKTRYGLLKKKPRERLFRTIPYCLVASLIRFGWEEKKTASRPPSPVPITSLERIQLIV